MKRVMMLVFPTDWSPRKTSLYFARADVGAISGEISGLPFRQRKNYRMEMEISVEVSCNGNSPFWPSSFFLSLIWTLLSVSHCSLRISIVNKRVGPGRAGSVCISRFLLTPNFLFHDFSNKLKFTFSSFTNTLFCSINLNFVIF